MNDLWTLLESHELVPGLSEKESILLTQELSNIANLTVYWRSITASHNALFFLGQIAPGTGEKRLGILYAGQNEVANTFAGDESDITAQGRSLNLRLCPKPKK